MNVQELMLESLELMALGMGSVFIILSLLIIIITLIAKLVPEPVVAKPAPVKPSHSGSIDPQHVAAIQSAIHQYRRSRGH